MDRKPHFGSAVCVAKLEYLTKKTLWICFWIQVKRFGGNQNQSVWASPWSFLLFSGLLLASQLGYAMSQQYSPQITPSFQPPQITSSFQPPRCVCFEASSSPSAARIQEQLFPLPQRICKKHASPWMTSSAHGTGPDQIFFFLVLIIG